MLINKRSREKRGEDPAEHQKEALRHMDIANRVQKFVDCRTKDVLSRELYIVEGDSPWAASSWPGRGVPGHHARRGKIL